MKALEDNRTWDVVTLPARKFTIGSKWVYKIKYNSNRVLERFKVRLVSKRYNQQEALDYHEIFSPFAKIVTVRTVIVVATPIDWKFHQMDVFNIFLQ